MPNSSSRRYPNGTPFSLMRPGDEDSGGGAHLSVASFNLLAPVYVRPHDRRTGGIQPFAAFEWISEKDSEDVLGVETRCSRLLESLRSCGADVLCLQELQLERRNVDAKREEFVLPTWIRPMVEEEPYELHLPPQNELVGVAERNRRVLGNYVAVTSALLYRTDSLVAIKRSSSNNNDKQDGDTNTCVSLCLRGKRGSSLESMDPVTVTSVHLDATSEKKRVGQLAQCLRRARAVPGDTAPLQSISTILAGDMNQELFPGSCVRAFLADSNTEPTDDEMERECASDLRLNKEATPTKQQLKEWRNLHAEAADTAYDCCVALDRIDSGPTRAGYDRADPSSTEVRMAQWRLDHILYTSETLRPVASWSTLEDDPESCRTGLPNRKYGSDHVPVGALFRVLPTPQLPPEERMSLLSSLEKLLDGQKAALHEQETALDSDLARIELDVLPKENPAGSSTGKKNKKKGKPPPEIMDFMRRKRTVMRELKAEQREERRAFVKGLGNLQRLLIEETYGCTARQWVERV